MWWVYMWGLYLQVGGRQSERLWSARPAVTVKL